jgi:hypothetical protein
VLLHAKVDKSFRFHQVDDPTGAVFGLFSLPQKNLIDSGGRFTVGCHHLDDFVGTGLGI